YQCFVPKPDLVFMVISTMHLQKNVATPLTIHGQPDCHYQCFAPKPELVFMVSSTMNLQKCSNALTIHGQSDCSRRKIRM
ncbi:hypothetical protein AB6E63_17395, partial [Vibrio cyclitrophicus]